MFHAKDARRDGKTWYKILWNLVQDFVELGTRSDRTCSMIPNTSDEERDCLSHCTSLPYPLYKPSLSAVQA